MQLTMIYPLTAQSVISNFPLIKFTLLAVSDCNNTVIKFISGNCMLHSEADYVKNLYCLESCLTQ